MNKDIFGAREKALEAGYFREHDAKLLEKLRKSAKLDEIAVALAEKLKFDDPELLDRVRALGITADNVEAFFAAPLVQVAWAEQKVSKRETETVLRLAVERGIDEKSTAFAQLEEWLRIRPEQALFDAAIEAIRHGFSVLPPAERAERVKRLIESCHLVAEASGNALTRQFGFGDGVSPVEESVIDNLYRRLSGGE